MHKILLIELSATLRHAMLRLLRNVDFDVTSVGTFEEGLQILNSREGETLYQGVVMGWPPQTDSTADELFSALEEPRLRKHAVLAMAHDPDPAKRTWVARRGRTALLNWDEYTESVSTVKKLLSHSKEPTHPVSLPEIRPDSIKILFVDDSPSMRVYYRRLLSGQGYLVDVASNVAEALKKAKQYYFDVAIIDYFMPDHNGDALCRFLMNDPQTRHITAAILTSTYLDKVIKDSLEAGAVECMFKNEADELFLARISSISRTIYVNKANEEKRRELESILDSVGDGVYGVNADGLLTFVNPAAKRILGFMEDENLVGESPHSLFHFADEAGHPVAQADSILQRAYIAGDELKCWSTTFWNQKGRVVPVECTVHPIRVSDLDHQGSVVAFRDISERKVLEEKLRWQATHDPLTELFNRRYFESQLEVEVERLRDSDDQSALLYLDLDQFKYINDTAGHAAGDKLLAEVGRRLRTRLNDNDILARLGGDEFAILLRNTSAQNLVAAAESFRKTLSDQVFVHASRRYNINCSVGAAVIHNGIGTAGEVLADGDIACYIAKSQGRNKVHLFLPEDNDKSLMDSDLGWSSRLKDAIREDHFQLHFQPIVPIAAIHFDANAECGRRWLVRPEGRLAYYEVLIRMTDPDQNLIYPGAFLPTAERFNLMKEIDFWVVDHALKKLGLINKEQNRARFSINLSGHTIADSRLVPMVKEKVQQYHLDTSCITFEITETIAIASLDLAKQIIDELRSIGCQFSLDDFGTGFSSFSHMKLLPVDYIKIDGMFVQGVAKDAIDLAMVESINNISHSIGCKTIAEFVDSAAVLNTLRQSGIDYVQGYFVSRPLAELDEKGPLPIPKIGAEDVGG